MIQVMLDLETMGNGPDAAIIAIGAVAFDIKSRSIGAKFYRTVDLASSVAGGGRMDPSTVLWWMQQSEDARKVFAREGATIDAALLDFADWLSGSFGEAEVWGNGAAFDNVILASAYRRAGMETPWQYWNNRCYRTVRALHPHVDCTRVGTYHNAVDDAETQARHLIAMLNPEA